MITLQRRQVWDFLLTPGHGQILGSLRIYGMANAAFFMSRPLYLHVCEVCCMSVCSRITDWLLSVTVRWHQLLMTYLKVLHSFQMLLFNHMHILLLTTSLDCTGYSELTNTLLCRSRHLSASHIHFKTVVSFPHFSLWFAVLDHTSRWMIKYNLLVFSAVSISRG